MHCIYLLRSIGKPSSKSHWIYREDNRLFLCQCTTAKGTIGRLNFLLSFISILPAWKGKEGISSLLSLKTACITYQQMKWGTRQHSSRLLWHQQSLVQLFTLTMVSTQWDLHLTALLYPHEHISAVQFGLNRSSTRTRRSEQGIRILELVWRMVVFAGDTVFVFINLHCQLPVRNKNCNRLRSHGLCNALMRIWILQELSLFCCQLLFV